jgi:uncharacterized protein
VEEVCDFLERIPPEWVVQRLTADPPKDSLVAPLWMLDKQGTIEDIWAALEVRQTWQGRLLGSALPRT